MSEPASTVDEPPNAGDAAAVPSDSADTDEEEEPLPIMN